MTKLRVGEEVFGLEESVSGASLGDLYQLKVQTSRDGLPGVSVKTISEALTRAGERASEPNFDTLDLLDDEVFLQNLVGLVFLARRSAGQQVTFEQAAQVSFQDIELIADDTEEPELPKDEEPVVE